MSQAVSNEDLVLILEAARLAPSGTNRQPWRFVLLTEAPDREKIAGAVIQPFVIEAPAVFVCCIDKGAFTRGLVEQRLSELVDAGAVSREAAGIIYRRKMPDKVEDVVIPGFAYLDLGIAIEHMVLQATALGLGSCWVRLFNPDQVHESLSLSPEMEVVALLPVGYPAETPLPRPRFSSAQILLKAGSTIL
jgi:nitroreductase